MRQLALVLAIVAACHAGGQTGSDGTEDSDPLDPSLAPPLDTDPSHYPSNIWITDGMHKVQPTATPGFEHWADLHAARRETESFQVHVQNVSGATQSVSVTIGELVDARTGARLDTLVSREAYLDITTLSDANGALGATPDPLVPTVDPYVHEARSAFPVAVPIGEVRSSWIDVRVPADAPSGWYSGVVTVTDGSGAALATMPVRIAVWDFVLPATATLHTGFGSTWNGMCVQAYGGYSACGAYPGSGGDADRAVELTHLANATMFLDYRVSLAGTVYAAPTNNDWSHFDAIYGPLMNRDPEITQLWYTADLANATELASWADHFRTAGWLDRTSAYYCDEPPNGCSWTETQTRADFIHQAAPGLPTLLTTDISNATAHDLLDRVDIMVLIVESMEKRGMPSVRADYDSWLARGGKHLWWYQSCDEHESCANGMPGPATATWPSYMVDASPVRNRVFQWLAYVYAIEGELYYGTDYCWSATCGGQSDPWVSIYAFGGNGDGTLSIRARPPRSAAPRRCRSPRCASR
jgi:hypothetical protein